MIDRNIKDYLDKKLQPKEDNKIINEKYFKLPYIGEMSAYAENKLKQLIKQFCKISMSIKIAFTPTKLSSFFSLKDKKLDELKSFVVYKFICTGC